MIIFDDIDPIEYREKGDYVYKKDESMIFARRKNSKDDAWNFITFMNDEYRELFSQNSPL